MLSKLMDLPEPPEPDAGKALIGVEFAPVNHNDLLLVKGTFHYTPSLPTVVGNEGVVVLPLDSNTWRERVVVSARGLVPLPPAAAAD